MSPLIGSPLRRGGRASRTNALILIAIAVGIIGWGIPLPQAHDTKALGTWYNFPATCPTQDSCELFYNDTNRIPLSEGNNTAASITGVIAHLAVGCIALSNSATAYLQLQYAIYGSTTFGPVIGSNLTNWQNIGIVSIANFQPTFNNCLSGNGFNQDNYAVGNDFTLNSTAIVCTAGLVSCGYIFRVLGFAGAGQGDNPRFGFIGVSVAQTLQRVQTFQVATSLTTAFTYRVVTNFPVATNSATNFYWSATNLTGGAARCGGDTVSGKDFHCWEAGNGSCTIPAGNVLCPGSGTNTITFGTAFTGTVRTFMVGNSVLPNITLPFSTLTLFSTQAISV